MNLQRTTMAGDPSRIIWMMIVLTVAQVIKRWALDDYGLLRFDLGKDVLGTVIGFSIGLFIWTGLVWKFMRAVNPNAPRWSKFVELYLTTSLILVAFTLFNVEHLMATGGQRWQSGWLTWPLVDKFTQLVVFITASWMVTHKHSAAPAPLISPGSRGAV